MSQIFHTRRLKPSAAHDNQPVSKLDTCVKLRFAAAKQEAKMSTDPLLQPYQLKHLTLRNRIMTTSHEPAYPEDGMPKGPLPPVSP